VDTFLYIFGQILSFKEQNTSSNLHMKNSFDYSYGVKVNNIDELLDLSRPLKNRQIWH